MRGEVVGGIPLDTTDVWGCRNGRSVAGKVVGGVAYGWRIWVFRVRDDVEVMEEDPKDFLGDIDNLFTPDAIWTGLMHRCDEARWLGSLRPGRIVEVGKNSTGPGGEVSGRRGGQVGEEKAGDDAAG